MGTRFNITPVERSTSTQSESVPTRFQHRVSGYKKQRVNRLGSLDSSEEANLLAR